MIAYKYVFVIEETKERISQIVESVTTDIPPSSLVNLHEFHLEESHKYFGTQDDDTASVMRAAGALQLPKAEVEVLYAAFKAKEAKLVA
jgi:CRISPR/Cas system-associated protein Cas5 (RAMP superfamily)